MYKLAILSGLLMLAGIVGIIVTCVVRVQEHYQDTSLDYGIIMDAGSSSTKAYIYQWEHKTSILLPVISLSLNDDNVLQQYKVSPGIAFLAPNYSRVGDYLDPIIEWAKSIIPDHRIKYTPIFFQGTGALRELSNMSSAALITNVRYKLLDSDFYFDNTFASVLSGTDEAGYGFLAVNSLFEKFQADEDTSNIVTYGSLDLGSVSSSIAFMSEDTPPAPYAFTSNFNGTVFTIYAQSNDGLGINVARYAFNMSLLGNSIPPSGTVIFNPCVPVGYFENMTVSFDNGLTSTQNWYYMTGAASNSTYSCDLLVQSFVNTLTKSLAVPPVTGTFAVSDHYIDVKKFFKLKDNANILELGAKVNSFCDLTYGDAMGHHNKYANEVQYYCFMGNYIATLLEDFYGLSATQRHILWKDTVNDYPVTWALGSMETYVQGTAPDTSSRANVRSVRFFRTDGGIVVLFISCLLFVLGIVLFVLNRHHHKNSDYAPLIR